MNNPILIFLLVALNVSGIILTFTAQGWFLLFLGLGFISILIIQFVIYYKSNTIWPKFNSYKIVSSIILFFLCILRENFGDGVRSKTNPISFILYKTGKLKYAQYKTMEPFSSICNLIYLGWLILFIAQIATLIKINRYKNTF